MRLLKHDTRTGHLRLGIDDLDDLWTLQHLIEAGDLVTADTVRTAETQEDQLRGGKAEKRRMRLGLRVQQVEWHDFADHLRVHGLIETGPQDHGKHHTIAFTDEPGTELVLDKAGGALTAWQLDLVKEAAENAKRPRVVILAIDDSEAQLSVVRGYGIQHLGSIAATGQGKRHMDTKAKPMFYDEVTRSVATLRRTGDGPPPPLVVVGPGWWRTEWLEHAAKADPDAAAGAVTEGTGQGGRAGVQEAITRGLVARVQRDGRVAAETALVEEALARIAKGRLVAYGPTQVAASVGAGAVEALLVADSAVRGGDFTDLLRAADQARAKVHVVATGHDAGAKVASLGGVLALLRFDV